MVYWIVSKHFGFGYVKSVDEHYMSLEHTNDEREAMKIMDFAEAMHFFNLGGYMITKKYT